MKQAKRAFKIVTNKYVIALFLFALQMVFFDDNNLFVQLDRKRQLHELLTHKKYYEDKITATSDELRNLQTSPASIEKFVRENFKMKRDNEDLFVVDDTGADTSVKK